MTVMAKTPGMTTLLGPHLTSPRRRMARKNLMTGLLKPLRTILWLMIVKWMGLASSPRVLEIHIPQKKTPVVTTTRIPPRTSIDSGPKLPSRLR